MLFSRREMLRQAGFGFGAWALLDLLQRDAAHAAHADNPLAAKAPPLPAHARRVIFLFMQGGPSHIDTFDPKPLLTKLHGQPLPPSAVNGLQLQFTKTDASILGSPQTFTKCGKSGLQIADTYPNLQTCADDLAIVRSCHHDSFNHAPAQYLLNTGSARMGRPCLGSWTTYGLGSVSENLPAFVVMTTTDSVKGGPPVYGHGFLPGAYQPTVLRNAGSPILYLDSPTPERRPARRARHGAVAQPRTRGGPRRGRGRPLLAHRLLRAGLSDAGGRAGGGGPRPGAGDNQDPLWVGRSRVGSVRRPTAFWPGGWWSAASASCRSSPALPAPTTGTPPTRTTTKPIGKWRDGSISRWRAC